MPGPKHFIAVKSSTRLLHAPVPCPDQTILPIPNGLTGGFIIDESAAQALASSNGFKKEDPLVSFCNTGHWAATNWFALSELGGIEAVKLYPESMVGWSHAKLPMANTPGLLENLLNKITR